MQSVYSTPQPTGLHVAGGGLTPLHYTLREGVLPLCRDAVSVFYTSANCTTRCGGVLPLWRDVVSVFYTPANWATRCGRGSYPSAEMQSVQCTAPANWVLFSRFLRIVPRVLIMIGFSVTFLFHWLLSSLRRSGYLINFPLLIQVFLSFYLLWRWMQLPRFWHF